MGVKRTSLLTEPDDYGAALERFQA